MFASMPSICRPERPPEILHAGFNQDGTCFALGTRRGFMIFCAVSRQLLHREDCGAVRLVEMLFRTSLVAFSGIGAEAAKLTMWNTKDRGTICELSFSSEVCAVRMNPRRLIVLLRPKVHVFDLLTMKSLHVVDRCPSPRVDPALGWLCPDPERGFLATPIADAGSATVAQAGSTQGGGSGAGIAAVLDTHTLRAVGAVVAHKSPLQALCLNPTGQFMASASSKGTVVRVFAVPSLELLHELRRGTSPCRIFGLNFSRDSALICASAASGTVHVFRGPAASQWSAGTGTPPSPAPRGCRPAEEELAEGDELDALAADIDNVCELGAEDLSEWNVVADRSQWCPEDCSSYNCISTSEDKVKLKAFAKQASRHVVRSLMQQVVQPCRELVDVPGAVALVHLSGCEMETDSCQKVCTAQRRSLVAGLQCVLRGSPEAVHAHVGYVAYVNAHHTAIGGKERLEVLVVTKNGCALCYELGSAVGTECRLLREDVLIEPQEEQPPLQQQQQQRELYPSSPRGMDASSPPCLSTPRAAGDVGAQTEDPAEHILVHSGPALRNKRQLHKAKKSASA